MVAALRLKAPVLLLQAWCLLHTFDQRKHEGLLTIKFRLALIKTGLQMRPSGKNL
jgi:hypothetical protein